MTLWIFSKKNNKKSRKIYFLLFLLLSSSNFAYSEAIVCKNYDSLYNTPLKVKAWTLTRFILVNEVKDLKKIDSWFLNCNQDLFIQKIDSFLLKKFTNYNQISNFLNDEKLLDSYLINIDDFIFKYHLKVKNSNFQAYDYLINYNDLKFNSFSINFLWSFLFFNHPYLNKQEWLNVLNNEIENFNKINTEFSFHKNCIKILKLLKDNHASFRPSLNQFPNWDSAYYPKLRVSEFNKKYYVTNVQIDSLKYLLGLEIIEFNGISIKEHNDSLSLYFPLASSKLLNQFVSFNLFIGEKNSVFSLVCRDSNGKKIKTDIKRDTNTIINLTINTDHCINKQIRYFNFTRIENDKGYNSIYQEIKKTPEKSTVIIDLRGHLDIYPPNKITKLLRCGDFSQDSIYFKQRKKNSFNHFKYDYNLFKALKSKKRNINILLLVNEFSVSSTEFFILELKRQGAIIIGDTTGGATGFVSNFVLPDKSLVRYTEIGVESTQYKDIYFNGLPPDILYIESLKNILIGKDGLLEFVFSNYSRF